MKNITVILFIFLIDLISFIRLSDINEYPYGYIIIYTTLYCPFIDNYVKQNNNNIGFIVNNTADSNGKYKMEMHFKNSIQIIILYLKIL